MLHNHHLSADCSSRWTSIYLHDLSLVVTMSHGFMVSIFFHLQIRHILRSKNFGCFKQSEWNNFFHIFHIFSVTMSHGPHGFIVSIFFHLWIQHIFRSKKSGWPRNLTMTFWNFEAVRSWISAFSLYCGRVLLYWQCPQFSCLEEPNPSGTSTVQWPRYVIYFSLKKSALNIGKVQTRYLCLTAA